MSVKLSRPLSVENGLGLLGLHNSKDCKTCNRTHGPTCWVENPEKAPKEKQQHYRKLKEKLLSDKQTENEKEAEDKPKNLGFISFINQPDTDDFCLDSGTLALPLSHGGFPVMGPRDGVA